MDNIAELIDYQCGDCNGTLFEIKLVHHSNGKTSIAIICGNKKCVEKKKKEIGLGEGEYIFWDEYDISNQCEHYDLGPLGKKEPGLVN